MFASIENAEGGESRESAEAGVETQTTETATEQSIDDSSAFEERSSSSKTERTPEPAEAVGAKAKPAEKSIPAEDASAFTKRTQESGLKEIPKAESEGKTEIKEKTVPEDDESAFAKDGEKAAGSEHPPNSIVNTEKGRFRTDDNGECHMYFDKENAQWKLIPDNKYEVNGYKYETDSEGRIVHAEGKLHFSEEEGRKPLNANVEGMEEGDERGHIIADQFDGSNRIDNLVPQSWATNHIEYREMEREIANDIAEGKEVEADYYLIYEDGSKRPDTLVVNVISDGETRTYLFENYRKDD